MRIELFNKISEDILKNNDNINDIKKEVESYSKLLEGSVGNAYELLTMGNDCPLFVLLYTLEMGADNFCMSDDEFEAEIKRMKDLFNQKFSIDFDTIKGE